MNEIWSPTREFVDNSILKKYRNWLVQEKDISPMDYLELWQWSIEHIDDFWSGLLEFFKVQYEGSYTSVRTGSMPRVKWFEGIKLNYAEHLFRNKRDEEIGIISNTELGDYRTLKWKEIKSTTAQLAQMLSEMGVRKGDRVAGFLPNIPEASISFFSTCAIGAVWSSCSPDFGAESVIDRFGQIQPKVLIACNGYTYNGKPYNKLDVIRKLVAEIPSIEHVIIVPFLNDTDWQEDYRDWNEITNRPPVELTFERVGFNDPIWVLYSSGTTGAPKSITHGHGGMLLEHLKYLSFHNDVHPGDRFFWFSTTGWMMWNFVNASALVGATIVLYEGSPAYPDLDVLWKYAERAKINHFGTSAPFIVACMKKGIIPKDIADLSSMISLGSTGAPLPPEAFDYVLRDIKLDLWLCSMSGGTDVCTAFVGGCPERPVYAGEIQCRALGCHLEAWDDKGHGVRNEVGEMVIIDPMPCMPIYFWNDPESKKYHSSYFNVFPDVWRHGDWLEITERDSLIIHGRSDATLNRHGVRIGTAEIYNVVEHFDEIQEALIVNLELSHGRHYMPLFVVLKSGISLSDELKLRINKALQTAYSPRHVPDEIIDCESIPKTISGKKMEAPVKKLLLGMELAASVNIGAMKNPESLQFFINLGKRIREE